MPDIDAVILDLGGVILNIDYLLTRKAFEELGIKDFDSMYSQAEADKLFQKLEKGTITSPMFFDDLRTCVGLNIADDEITTAWNAMLLDFRETTLGYLENLSKKYRLFLLSNTNSIHLEEFQKIYRKKVRAQDFESYFETAYYSFAIGMRKPDLEIYQFVLRENELDPEKTIFIDDSKQNVGAAVAAGMQGILLEPGVLVENLSWAEF